MIVALYLVVLSSLIVLPCRRIDLLLLLYIEKDGMIMKALSTYLIEIAFLLSDKIIPLILSFIDESHSWNSGGKLVLLLTKKRSTGI